MIANSRLPKITFLRKYKLKGAVHKGRPRSRKFVQCGNFRDKGVGVLQMRTSALIDAKNFGHFEIYSVSARTRSEGVQPVRTFSGQGKGGHFLRFCADVLYERPQSLWLVQVLLTLLYAFEKWDALHRNKILFLLDHLCDKNVYI